jgi:hypothetical protein
VKLHCCHLRPADGQSPMKRGDHRAVSSALRVCSQGIAGGPAPTQGGRSFHARKFAAQPLTNFPDLGFVRAVISCLFAKAGLVFQQRTENFTRALPRVFSAVLETVLIEGVAGPGFDSRQHIYSGFTEFGT